MSHSAMIKDLTFGTAFKMIATLAGMLLFKEVFEFIDTSETLTTITLYLFFGMLAIGAVMATIAIVKHIFNNFFRIVATISGMVAVWYILDYIN